MGWFGLGCLVWICLFESLSEPSCNFSIYNILLPSCGYLLDERNLFCYKPSHLHSFISIYIYLYSSFVMIINTYFKMLYFQDFMVLVKDHNVLSFYLIETFWLFFIWFHTIATRLSSDTWTSWCDSVQHLSGTQQIICMHREFKSILFYPLWELPLHSKNYISL